MGKVKLPMLKELGLYRQSQKMLRNKQRESLFSFPLRILKFGVIWKYLAHAQFICTDNGTVMRRHTD